MKKTLYLVRHGQTVFNVRRKIQGWCDSPLTELGRAQAGVAAEYFRSRGITFDTPTPPPPSGPATPWRSSPPCPIRG